MKINKKQIIKKIQKDLRKDFGVLFELDKKKSPDYQICDIKMFFWLEKELEELL